MTKQLFSLALIALMAMACTPSKQTSTEPVVDSTAHTSWVYDAVIYEVNTRQHTPEGTFAAFQSHLPRLKELGVDILWFMPIQPIGEVERKGTLGSYYSIKDYVAVNPEFGTLDDFKRVVDEAHQQGMKVILDWVANHTSRDAKWLGEHPYWYTTDSLGNVLAPYDWTDVADLNYDNADMRAQMIQDMLFWVREADIDGFRCDVASEVPTDFWEVAKDSLLAVKPSLFMLAEAEEPSLHNKAFDAYYAWDMHHRMNAVAQGKEPVDSLRQSLTRMQTRFVEAAIPMFFTSNHDENSWNGTEFERMGNAAEAFAVLSYTLPGMPLIYNGQEVGFNRRLSFFEKDSIDWNFDAPQMAFYTKLNALKKSHPALKSPELGNNFVEIPTNQPATVWAFSRTLDSDTIVCVFNFSANPQTVEFSNPLPIDGLTNWTTGESAVAVSTIELTPWEYRIYTK